MRYLFLLCFLFPFTLLAQDGEDVLYYNKGVKAHNSRDYTSAIQYYEKCLVINPDYVEAKHNMIMVYYNQSLAAFNKNDFDNTLKYSNNALRLAPNNPEVYALVGNTHIRQKKYQEAIVDFTKAIEHSAQPAAYYAARAWAYSDLLDNVNRLADMEQAAKLEPSNAKYQFLAGKYKQRVGTDRFKLALDNYNKAIELKPDYLEAYTERAAYFMTFGDFDKALKDLHQAEKLGGDVKDMINVAEFELEMQNED